VAIEGEEREKHGGAEISGVGENVGGKAKYQWRLKERYQRLLPRRSAGERARYPGDESAKAISAATGNIEQHRNGRKFAVAEERHNRRIISMKTGSKAMKAAGDRL